MSDFIDEYERDGFSISTDKNKLNLDVIFEYLSAAYWSPGISKEQIQRSIEHSFCFGVYNPDHKQVGFARVVTDFASAGYLADVFILEKYSGKGLGQWLISTIVSHPRLQVIRRFLLFTNDAHSLYAKYGFQPLNDAGNCMQIYRGVEFRTRDVPDSNDSGLARRRTELIETRIINNWKLKIYSISAGGDDLPGEVLKSVIEFVSEQFTWPENLEPGFGFVTVHFGEDAIWLLIDLWANEILHHFIYAASFNSPPIFRPAPDDGTAACVWELEITKYERDAWVKHVLSKPQNENYEAYMSDAIRIEVA